MTPSTLLLLTVLSPAFLFSQKTIITPETSARLSMRNAYVTEVIDERDGTGDIGLLNNKAVDIAGGLSQGLQRYISDHIQMPGDADAVSLHVNAFSISESRSSKGKKTTLNARFSFYKDGENLAGFAGSSSVEGNADPLPYLKKMIAESVQSLLHDFDNWYGKNRQRLEDSKKLVVNVTLLRNSNDRHLIMYDPGYRVQPSDFTGAADRSSAADAATYSGFRISFEMNNKTGPYIANIEVMPYMDRSRSWAKKTGKNPYVMRHEQMHFHITGYITCAFINELKRTNFTQENIRQELDAIQQRYVALIDETQALYDKETDHGLKKDKQQEWNEKILQEVMNTNCY